MVLLRASLNLQPLNDIEVGIRDAERVDYERAGGDFSSAEPGYRQGFEAAMRPRFRGRAFDQASSDLRDLYPEYFGLKEFQHGYERGRRHRKEPSVT